MEFPRYRKNDVIREQFDGGYFLSDFEQLFEDLLSRDEFENDIEKGIAAKLVSEGTYDLSEKQSYHVQNIFDRYNSKECTVCGETIPLSEVLYLDGGLCSYHQNQFERD